MGAIESSIKKEIGRLARREARQLVRPLREELKRQKARNVVLSDRLNKLEKSREIEQAGKKLEVAASGAGADKRRLSPRLIKSLRTKIGVTQVNLARLVGVTGQAVVSWESGKTKPRPELRQKLLGLRSMSKREIRIALETIVPNPQPPVARRSRRRVIKKKNVNRGGKRSRKAKRSKASARK